MNNIPYIDILILAMVAIFIINKLRNTLGKKTGNEHDIANKFTRGKSDLKESSPDKVSKAKVDKINPEESKHIFHENPGISSELSKIHKIDPSFQFGSQSDEELKDYLDKTKRAIAIQAKSDKKRNNLIDKHLRKSKYCAACIHLNISFILIANDVPLFEAMKSSSKLLKMMLRNSCCFSNRVEIAVSI